MARRSFNTRDGAKIGQAFHDQVKEATGSHPGYDAIIFTMCFGPLSDGLRSEKARFWMQCAMAAECEAIRGESNQEAA